MLLPGKEEPGWISLDAQVLLRGSRIVLSEVEAVLEGVPGVEQAVALVQDDPTGAQRLVAYVTPASADGGAVLAALRGKLPAHLMPASVTALPQVRPRAVADVGTSLGMIANPPAESACQKPTEAPCWMSRHDVLVHPLCCVHVVVKRTTQRMQACLYQPYLTTSEGYLSACSSRVSSCPAKWTLCPSQPQTGQRLLKDMRRPPMASPSLSTSQGCRCLA